MTGPMNDIKTLKSKVQKDLFTNIIPFWLSNTIDIENGGFYGRIANNLVPEPNAPKSLILHTRVLWSFAFLYGYKNDPAYLDIADRAYNFLIERFMDNVNGGMFWLLDVKGNPLETYKKMYGQAFTIYAFSEYYKITKNEDVLNKAIEIFRLIEKNNYDPIHKGYYEGSSREWKVDKNISLSAVDMNEVKSMNTHLHIMEAYTTLYSVWPDATLKGKLIELIHLHLDHIISPETNHLKLFFDEAWCSKSKNISFGHDIEASWLLCEAAKIINDPVIDSKIEKVAIDMVKVIIKDGFDQKDAIYGARESDGTVHTQLEWWQQAEAMVGFVNAWQITGDEDYLNWTVRMWTVIEKYIIDHKDGEWFYGVASNGDYDHTKFKVSEWKGPYHNVRACVEVLRRLPKEIDL